MNNPTPPPPSETPVTDNADEGSPNWAAKIRGDLAARGYERINDPRKRESRTEIKQRVIQAGGTMDEAFEEIKRVETQSPPSETKLKEAIDDLLSAHEEVVSISILCENRPGSDQRFRAARSSLESLYRELLSERDTLIEHARIDAAMHRNCMRERAALEVQLSKTKADLCGEVTGLCDVVERRDAELSALRSLQLTQHEAKLLLDVATSDAYLIEEHPVSSPILEKLRISSKATSEEL